MTLPHWLRRVIFLETVAGVPGMVCTKFAPLPPTIASALLKLSLPQISWAKHDCSLSSLTVSWGHSVTAVFCAASR